MYLVFEGKSWERSEAESFFTGSEKYLEKEAAAMKENTVESCSKWKKLSAFKKFFWYTLYFCIEGS